MTPVSQRIDPSGLWTSLEHTRPTDLASVRRAIEALLEDLRLRPDWGLLAAGTRTEGVAPLEAAFELAEGPSQTASPRSRHRTVSNSDTGRS